MISVSMEVCSEATRLRVTVCAESIERALEVVSARHPNSEATVLFPIDPEALFAKGPMLVPGVVLLESRELKVG